MNAFANLETKGKIVLESEHYQDDGELYEHTIDNALSLFARFEASYETERTLSKIGFIYRENQKDRSRDMLLPRDVYSSFEIIDWKVLFGYKLYNWSTLEAFHPTAGLHSPNFGSSPENWEKGGSLVLELQRSFDWGAATAYFFPRFQEAIYPDSNSRRALIKDGSRVTIKDTSLKIVDGEIKETDSIPQFGFRLDWSGDSMDVGAYYLRHLERRQALFGTHEYRSLGQPPHRIVIPKDFRAFTFNPTPYYVMAGEVGLTLEAVAWDTLWKFEGVHLTFDDHDPILTGQNLASTGNGLRIKEDYTHLALGVEKAFNWWGQETVLMAEYSRVFGVPEDALLYTETFQNDIFIGIRHDFSDSMNRSINIGYIHDLDDGPREETLLYAKYGQRLGPNWSAEFGGRRYNAPPPTEKEEEENLRISGLEVYHEANSYFFNFSLHF